MFQNPPLVASVSINVTNVAGNSTFIAAPGAGLAIRLISCNMGLGQSVAAGAFELAIQDGVGGTGIGNISLQSPGERWHELVGIPEPGYQLSEDTLLNISRIGSIAGPSSVRCYAYYYVDSIT